MTKSNCPRAAERLERIALLRKQTRLMRACAGGKDDGELACQCEKRDRQLETLKNDTLRLIRKMPSPALALLIEMVFVFGVDRDVLTAGLGLSRSGFRARFSRAMRELEDVMEKAESEAAHEAVH